MKLSDDAKRLLDGANFAHLATLQPDGAPKSEPVWVAREEDHLLVTSDARSLKGQNLARCVISKIWKWASAKASAVIL